MKENPSATSSWNCSTAKGGCNVDGGACAAGGSTCYCTQDSDCTTSAGAGCAPARPASKRSISADEYGALVNDSDWTMRQLL